MTTKIDISDLRKEKLTEAPFPAELKSDLRLYFDPSVHTGIWEHASADTSVEICGVLVGHWGQDTQGPYAVVTNYIRSKGAASKHAEVTFTHESWADINKQMDAQFDDKRIIGWYHSHPDFGIFLSDRDVFIHEHFFFGPGQVAHVVDPVRKLEGVFSWQSGQPKPMPHFWIGDRILTVEASERRRHESDPPPQVATSVPRQSSPDDWGISPTMLMLTCLALILLGYLLGSTKSNWEQQAIIRGTVAHYGYDKVLKFGLGKDLQIVGKALGEIAELQQSISLGEDSEENQQKQKLVAYNLLLVHQELDRIRKKYEFSEDEAREIQRLIAMAEREEKAALEAKSKSEEESSTESKPKAGKSSAGEKQTPAATKTSLPKESKSAEDTLQQ